MRSKTTRDSSHLATCILELEGEAMLRRALLIGGAVSSALYIIAIDVVAARRHPEYHEYTSQMVSELLAIGAPTRPLMVWMSVPYNLLVFGLALGVWLSAGGHRARQFLAGSLVGYAILSSAGLFLAPMDLRGTLDSQRDSQHIAVTFLMSLFIMASIASGAFVQGRWLRLYSLGTLALVLVGGGLAGLLARPMPGETPGVGLAERVNIYATMIWFAVLALSLLPAAPTPAAHDPWCSSQTSSTCRCTAASDPLR